MNRKKLNVKKVTEEKKRQKQTFLKMYLPGIVFFKSSNL